MVNTVLHFNRAFGIVEAAKVKRLLPFIEYVDYPCDDNRAKQREDLAWEGLEPSPP